MHRSTTTPLTRIATLLLLGAAVVALSGCSMLQGIIGGEGVVVEGDGESTDVFSLAVGDCLNDLDANGEVSAVPKVDCVEPHDSEVYLSVLMDDGDFPGAEAITTASEDGCLRAFDAFVGAPYETSLVDYNSYQPTEATWAAGDREILCIVMEYDVDGNPVKTVGSLAGTGK